MTIFTSCFGNLKKIVQLGLVPVSIAIKPPGYYTGSKYFKVAPTLDMLQLKWEDYVPRYQAILSHLDPKRVHDDIKILSGGRDIALLCFEPNPSECHRMLLAYWLNNTLGLNIAELDVEEYEGKQSGERSLFPDFEVKPRIKI